jgi:hypothetical protein
MPAVPLLFLFVVASAFGWLVVRAVRQESALPPIAIVAAISPIIVVGALAAAAETVDWAAQWLSLVAIALASTCSFGCFTLADRLLVQRNRNEE